MGGGGEEWDEKRLGKVVGGGCGKREGEGRDSWRERAIKRERLRAGEMNGGKQVMEGIEGWKRREGWMNKEGEKGVTEMHKEER